MNKVTLPWPPKQLSPNARVHWAVKAKAAKIYRADCFNLAKQAGVKFEEEGKIHLFVDFYCPDKRARDSDNLLSSMKSAIDGLADALKVNDSRFVIHPFVRDEIIKGGQVVITISS
jgi:crossover junction endodeoxyribonuclease RusA